MSTEWLFWGSSIIVAACGLALLAWALFSDRSRGRKRCCKCWYSMNHATSLRCPECGYEARSERKLLKTRRRWRWVMASAIPLLLAAFLAVQPKVQRDGWGSVLPATVMILLLRVDDRPWVLEGIQYHVTETHEHPAMGTPMYVPMEERLWNWQWRLLGRTVLHRIKHEDRSDVRMQYHFWLSVTREWGGCDTLSEQALDVLIHDMSHADARVRMSAALSGIDYGDIQGSIERAQAMLQHDDPMTQHAGMASFRLLLPYSDQAIVPIVEAMKHWAPNVRTSAVAAVGRILELHGPQPDVYEAVHALHDDPHGEVREWRIKALALLESAADARNTIADALRSDDPYERRGGLYAMEQMQNRPLYIAALAIDLLDDESDIVRNVAAGLLQYLTHEEWAARKDLLWSLLSHDDTEVRNAASRALTLLGE